ncbi:hypothetical protein GCM10010129_08140 [Streptomyces fumigatiscleroticus]|nr:hypothetical protein GCM10010129_08140 [Streptomyces fumigatiscleroticus]
MADPRQREKYEQDEGGSAGAEREFLREPARSLVRAQEENGHAARPRRPGRALHARTPLTADDARLRFPFGLPPAPTQGYARPGTGYRAVVRMSSAAGTPHRDAAGGLRGSAVRSVVPDGERHGPLLLGHPLSYAADARESVGFATATAGATSAPRVARPAADRGLRALRAATGRTPRSPAPERCRGQPPTPWGNAGPVRYQPRPVAGEPDGARPDRGSPDRLHDEPTRRPRRTDAVLKLCPPVPVARLTVPGQDTDSARGRTTARRVEQPLRTPRRTADAFRPPGGPDRSRDPAYGAHRLDRTDRTRTDRTLTRGRTS